MENASKALIIAGAILIAIVLVSVGVIVVNSLNTDNAVSTMTEQEIKAFNAKFESSTGPNVSGSVVKSLIATVITNNSTNDASRQIKITLSEATKSGTKVSTTPKYTAISSVTDTNNKDLTHLKNDISTGTKYTVTPAYTNGLITAIDIVNNV